ncbi:MAG: LamG domain-containing protein [Bacteroidales bacterium]|nr:LamG domain-containing protein [Bacteroidales bacterium]
MSELSPLINKNSTRQETHKYIHTSMVSHLGMPVSFAMRYDGRIFYSVLDMSATEQNSSTPGGLDQNNDKNYWSQVTFEGAGASRLHFPSEIVQTGYGVVPNFQIDKYDSNNRKIIRSYDSEGKPLDAEGKPLSDQAIKDKTDTFFSSTARLGAPVPFQVLSDGKYVYVFRQSIAADNPYNESPDIVNNTLLVDRFILSGTVLKLSREIRYQRSRHKTEPESRKDTLAALDVEGNPFHEPTRELVFANNLSDGNFSVLLIPGVDSEEQRWQIFTVDSTSNKVNSFNTRFDYSIVFDPTDSHTVVDEFMERYALDGSFISRIQAKVTEGKSDDDISNDLSRSNPFDYNNLDEKARLTLRDALSEVVYTIRTGVSKDDFVLESASEWPLIEYESDGGSIKAEYLSSGVLQKKYTFQGPAGELAPDSLPYQIRHGLTSCYYYQQEMGPDGKPMKNKACVMLAMGLEDNNENKYIGILNFAAAASGRLSRLTADAVNMPDINVQALDENPYSTLEQIPRDENNNRIAWQYPQLMRLLDIDPNGLGTSGGVLKFAYTSAEISESQGYSDAAEATDPFLFDDSLGRVNLYFKGRKKNFFVLYFNPTGSKSVSITDTNAQNVSPTLSLKPRLDRDMAIEVAVTAPTGSNSCTLTMTSKDNKQEVEQWHHLPRRFDQIAAILNGNGELPLGTLEPLGKTDYPRAAYLKPSRGRGKLKLRTTADNNLMFRVRDASAAHIADGKTHKPSLLQLSACLANSPALSIAGKSFSLSGKPKVEADIFHKSYLSGLVNGPIDVDKLWGYLKAQALIKEVAGQPAVGNLKAAALSGNPESLSKVLKDIGDLVLELLKEGNEADKKARRARLKQSLISLILDVANVRILTFEVVDTNIQSVDRLEAGLTVSVLYDYSSHFACTPGHLGGASASKWEKARSYLFNAAVEYDENTGPATEISDSFNYLYTINNAIGQWEDWEASLALELTPKSATNGAALSTSDDLELEKMRPTEKGLSIEAWVKPSKNPGKLASIIHFEKSNVSYSLGIEKDGAENYKCVATLGGKKYTSKKAFKFQNARKEQWRHLAFAHQKYWGYQLGSSDTIDCGNDSSLQLNDEFTLEAMVRIDAAGRLMEKQGEYSLGVDSKNEIKFDWAGENLLFDWVRMNSVPTANQQNDEENYRQIDYVWYQKTRPVKLNALHQFYKITLIRSRNKPRSEPTNVEYPITGRDQDASSGGDASKGKWYEDGDKNTDELIKGMAEKQDQMENKMEFSQTDMLGNVFGNTPASSEHNPGYYHTLLVTKEDGSTQKWTSETAKAVEKVEAYKDFVMGGSGFAGTFASVRIWNRALSTSEGEAFPLPENKTGLLSHWRMEEGKGNYLYDEVSENHGVAKEGKWTDSPQANQVGQFQFYVDGTPEAHDTAEDSTTSGVGQFSIGGIKKGNGFGNHFKGTLEEIRIWNVPRTNEQITDNAFGLLKGEWEQLLANYTFDKPMSQTKDKAQDASVNSIQLTPHQPAMLKEVLSTAPIATEIPQIRSALTGVLTDYNCDIHSRPGVVEYGDVQLNDDGTLNGILKRCYSFIGADGVWNRMTGYKVGNLVSQWYGQAQFAPQVMGFLEGPPPVPAENFPVGKDADVDTYAFKLDNSVNFRQAEEISYNYSTSKEAGWNVAAKSEAKTGIGISTLIAPFGFGLSFELDAQVAVESNWETSGKRSQSYERGTRVNTERSFSAALAGYDNGESGDKRYYKLDNSGYALVKSKTADIYLLRLAHNNALVSIFWRPNPDIPEDVNIVPFPINPLYTKQGTLDGKFGETTDAHYPQAHGAYGHYSYFKPREAYRLKKQIEREKMELKAYFEDSFDVARTNAHFNAAAATTGIAQLSTIIPVFGPIMASVFNQTAGQLATQVGYNNTRLKDDLAKMGSQRNLVNTYVWTVEGGFYAEATEVAETQQETFANETGLVLGGGLGVAMGVEGGGSFEQKTMISTGSSFTLTKSKTKSSKTSFGLDVNVGISTSPRYKYAGTDGRTLVKGLIKPGVVDAYRFMSFYLEPKGKNFVDLFTRVIDPIWLDESPDPNAQALRQARGNIDKAKPCWRILHRVTYVSRILPEFQPQAPPSLEKAMQVSGIESNYMLIKKFEPYVANIPDSGAFFSKIEEIIDAQLPEFKAYKQQIKNYLALYFNMGQA